MIDEELRDLIVRGEKSANELGGIAKRAIHALGVVVPMLAKVGVRLAEWDRLQYAERHSLAENVAKALSQASKIMDGKLPGDDDG